MSRNAKGEPVPYPVWCVHHKKHTIELAEDYFYRPIEWCACCGSIGTWNAEGTAFNWQIPSNGLPAITHR